MTSATSCSAILRPGNSPPVISSIAPCGRCGGQRR